MVDKVRDDDNDEKTPLWNYGLMGKCYDIVFVDPDAITNRGGQAAKGPKLVDAFSLGEQVDIPDQNKRTRPEHLTYSPGNFMTGTKTKTEQLSSYDFQTYVEREASVTVSDPAEQAFCATVSAAFDRLQQDTETRKSAVTSASDLVGKYYLEVSEKAPLSDALTSAFGQLPERYNESDYEDFLTKYGTHYLHKALYGGRRISRISVEFDERVSFLDQGIDMQAQATLALDFAKISGNTKFVDRLNQKVVQSSKVRIENVAMLGGTAQEDFDSWALTLDDQPMPVTAEFHPLYELLSSAHLPQADPGSCEKKQSLLKQATKGWLARNGKDLRSKLLCYGDKIGIELVAPGPTRLISADTGTYVRMVPGRTAASSTTQQWVLDDPNAPGSKKEIVAGRDVVLRSAATGKLLDAQAGSDLRYEPGDGLAGTVDDRGGKIISTHWGIEIGGKTERSNLADGDNIHLRSRWKRDESDDDGFLVGETSRDDPAQRVWAFGGNNKVGTFWAIHRVPTST